MKNKWERRIQYDFKNTVGGDGKEIIDNKEKTCRKLTWREKKNEIGWG